MKLNCLLKPSNAIWTIGLLLFTGFGCTSEGEVERESPHWEYENPDWQKLGYSECGAPIQTPIDIVTSKTVNANLDTILFDYNPFPMQIIDNGHTVQINKTGTAATTMTIDGVVYNFTQMHYHTKSEHAINGTLGDMEIHLVHQDPISKALSVVGVMLTDDAGGPDNPFIETYKDAFPEEENVPVNTNININLNDILPENRQYYTYTGSLTTPPCTQGLKWLLMKGVVHLSTAQLEEFSAHHGHNNRPLQPIGNRIVLEKK